MAKQNPTFNTIKMTTTWKSQPSRIPLIQDEQNEFNETKEEMNSHFWQGPLFYIFNYSYFNMNFIMPGNKSILYCHGSWVPDQQLSFSDCTMSPTDAESNH